MRNTTLAVIFLLWLGSSGLRAQDTSTIVGTVADASGAVIPNAKVTIQNSQNGFVRELTAIARFMALKPGGAGRVRAHGRRSIPSAGARRAPSQPLEPG
jgi:hypothetical protein